MSQFIITETIPYPKEILKILEENENLKKKLLKKQKKIFVLIQKQKLQDKTVSYVEKCLERIDLLEEVDKKQVFLLKNLQEEVQLARGIIEKFIHLVPGMGGFSQN